MKWTVAGIASVVYPILLGIGVLFAYRRLSDESYHAAVALPVNHLIASKELVASTSEEGVAAIALTSAADLHGYTRSDVRVGQVIRKTDLESRPLIVPDAGAIAFSVEVDSRRVTSGELNAGIRVAICDGEKVLVKDARILAVLCFAGTVRCTSVIEVPSEGSEEVIALLQRAQPSQIVIASGAKPASGG